VARDPAKNLVLYRVSPPARTTEQITGLYDDPTRPWSTGQVTWQRVDCRGGALNVEVSSDTTLFHDVVQTLSISGTTKPRTLRIPPNTDHRLVKVPLVPQRGLCRVVFKISPTRVPANFPELQRNDQRRLGLHFDSRRYTPPK
jgi:hypothetical protein